MSTPTAGAKPLTAKELTTFQALLEEKQTAVLDRARKTLTEDMVLDPSDLADEIDLAASESLLAFEVQLRGREKGLLAKIDLALKKIAEGTFGICETCEQPIGKKRLEARPETNLCVACKEDQERDERTFATD